MIFSSINQILSHSCLSLAFGFGRKSKPRTKSLHDLVLCTSSILSHAPCYSHSSPAPVTAVGRESLLHSSLTLRVSLPRSEFMFCSFCLQCFPVGGASPFRSLLRYGASLGTQSLLVPFWNKSPFRFCPITPAISNYLVSLIHFLLSPLLECELDEDRDLIGYIHCYILSV